MAESLLDATGNTPLLHIDLEVPEGTVNLYAKLERFNPSVSIKDRNVRAMIDAAEQSGELQAGGTVLEPVAGNTGIALAHICNVRGYQLILTMPEDYMPERRHILKRLGIKIETTPADQGIAGAVERAQVIKTEHPDYYVPDHFTNEVQVEAHRAGLVREILDDLNGVSIDAFIGSIGTGSSLVAIAEALKPAGTQIIAVEPAAAKHAIQGIGFGFQPPYLKEGTIDHVEKVSDQDAVQGFREMAAETGVLGGLSCGANYIVAKRMARTLGPDKNILTVFYDGGERYFSLEKELKNEGVKS